MVVIDTSALLRFFIRDSEPKYKQVQNLLNGDEDVCIPDVVIAELEYVFRKVYELPRTDIIMAYKFLLNLKRYDSSSVAKIAFQYYEQSRISMYDCFVLAHAFVSTSKIASYDKKLLRMSVAPFFVNQ